MWVAYNLDRNGAPENVRVRESADPCFDEVSVAAVQRWEFAPRRVNGRPATQRDLETVFEYSVDSPAPVSKTFDARPLKRIPPEFPTACLKSRPPGVAFEDLVDVKFDVTATGETENARVVSSPDECYNRAVLRSVKRWKYSPAKLDGAPVARRNVWTRFIFMVPQGRPEEHQRISERVRIDLNRAGGYIKTDPAAALALLAELEAARGDRFSDSERAAFHQIRGYARVAANDYEGALADLKAARARFFGKKIARGN